MSYLPCQNPDCGSVGQSHPNCHCYDHITGEDRKWAEAKGYQFPGTTKGLHARGVRGGNLKEAKKRGRSYKYMAEGGEVSQYCSGPHLPNCMHFVDGGPVPPAMFSDTVDAQQMPQPINPEVTLGFAGVAHGLLGLIKNVGHANMVEPEKHHKTMDKAKAHLAGNDHRKAAETLHGHALAGSASKDNLKHIMRRLGPAVHGSAHNPQALRGSIDYLNSAIKGHNSLDGHMKNVIGKGKLSIDLDEKSVESLKDHLDDLQENPAKVLETGGSLGHYLPDHAAGLGALTATALHYLETLKPTETKIAPLDESQPPDKMEVAKYERHLSIAQQPLLVLKYVKDGTLLPQDLSTLQVLYPALHDSIIEKAGEALIEAKDKEEEIPYNQRQSLSMLLGQPLDTSMTPLGMQAIMKSAGIQQMAKQQVQQQKKATSVEMKAIDKANSLYETPLEQRQIDKKG